MSCCSVGKRADAADIDAALRSGLGVRVVARRFSLGRSALGEHRKGCLGLAGRIEDGPDAPDTASANGCVMSAERPRTSSDDARAMLAPITIVDGAEGQVVGSFDERVLHLADLIARGHYRGRPTAKRLATMWGISRNAVQNYARAAAVVCRADRGDLEQAREASIGAWSRLREKAVKDGDWRAAAAAQAGIDRASGVVEPGGARVQVNVLQAPGVMDLLREVRGFLQARAPDLLPDLDDHLRGVMAARRGLPGRAA